MFRTQLTLPPNIKQQRRDRIHKVRAMRAALRPNPDCCYVLFSKSTTQVDRIKPPTMSAMEARNEQADSPWKPTVPDFLSQTKHEAHDRGVESFVGSVVRSNNAERRTDRAAAGDTTSPIFYPEEDLDIPSGIVKNGDSLELTPSTSEDKIQKCIDQIAEENKVNMQEVQLGTFQLIRAAAIAETKKTSQNANQTQSSDDVESEAQAAKGHSTRLVLQ